MKANLRYAMGNFATRRLNVQSRGAATAAEYHVGLIKGVKVIFTPGVELKAALKAVRFEQVTYPAPVDNSPREE
jgi:hypothetical protein